MAVVYFARKSFKDVGLLFPIIAWCSPLSHTLALDQTTSAFFLELSLSRLSFLLLGSDLRGFQSVPSSYEYSSATVGALFRWSLYRALKLRVGDSNGVLLGLKRHSGGSKALKKFGCKKQLTMTPRILKPSYMQ